MVQHLKCQPVTKHFSMDPYLLSHPTLSDIQFHQCGPPAHSHSIAQKQPAHGRLPHICRSHHHHLREDQLFNVNAKCINWELTNSSLSLITHSCTEIQTYPRPPLVVPLCLFSHLFQGSVCVQVEQHGSILGYVRHLW